MNSGVKMTLNDDLTRGLARASRKSIEVGQQAGARPDDVRPADPPIEVLRQARIKSRRQAQQCAIAQDIEHAENQNEQARDRGNEKERGHVAQHDPIADLDHVKGGHQKGKIDEKAKDTDTDVSGNERSERSAERRGGRIVAP